MRNLLSIGRDIRNEILYVLAAKPPLRVLITKAVMQYVTTWSAHPRLVSRLVSGVLQLDSRTLDSLTCVRMSEVATLSSSSAHTLYRGLVAYL